MGGRSAASWEEQWGNGSKGDAAKKKNESSRGKKVTDLKAALDKAKLAAMVGAQKLKTGTSLGFKWVKDHCHNKSSSK